MTDTPCPEKGWDLLVAALRLNGDPASISHLRIALLSDPAALSCLIREADMRMLLSAVLVNLKQYGLLHHNKTTTDALSQQLMEAHNGHMQRRATLAKGLQEIVALLNGHNIVPMLLKGSVSLWNGQPDWRYQRDIDIVVQNDECTTAFEALRAAGFNPMPGQKPVPHHMHPLIRGDIPASVEIHFATSNPRGEKYLSTNEFRQHSTFSKTVHGAATLPAMMHHLLHMVVHNHFTHRNATYGVAPLKGLYEFNWQICNASRNETEAMQARAAKHPRLWSATDLWLAAINDLFNTSNSADIELPTDARGRCANLVARSRNCKLPSLATAYWEETTMAATRAEGFGALATAWLQPLGELVSAPIWINRKEQALKSAGINPPE